ncbi:cytochrome c biogenesis protein CcsA [Paenibacillus protaetiae]|uniref:Cytochrome C assembly protein n=1 Tax=Paenibacillus protaetiae TaxID=2509456 RepID=A0A4P6EX30_9BACL|nr:cytochrome c biogenesis protein CcsA [Paenibacillus protaetiae]QAY65147.1 cytochrome C assembly protein [Paenibacillus protaetiae]
MGTANWLYDAILYIYALSLLFYFSDFMDANRRAKRVGTGLLIFVWVLQTVYVLIRIFHHLDLSAISTFEYWLGFSWLLITISVVMNRFFNIEFLVFFVNVIGFAVLALNLYSGSRNGVSIEAWETTRNLLYVHISLILCAYAALTLGVLFAAMYLFLHKQLKGKNWTKHMRRLPSLEMIKRYSDRAVMIGVPLLAMSLSVGATSIIVENRLELLLDWKVIFAFLAFISYIVYVVQRSLGRKPALKLAQLQIFSFILLVSGFFVNGLSSFH